MIHVNKLQDAGLKHPSLVTIGVFDGIHRGHQELIRQLVMTAHQADYKAVVLTFFPHPDVVLRGIESRYYLTTPDFRAQLLGDMGVDVVVTTPFDEQLRMIRAVDYADGLIQHLQMKTLWVGRDFAMGYKREGDVTYLTQLGAQKGFDVVAVDLVTHNHDGERISSSAIRGYLETGAVNKATELLGRSYCVQGEVIRGDRRGHTIGFPTANMDVWDQQVLPTNGVYAGWATLGEETFMAVTNVGIRPTFSGTDITIEPHLLDFDRDIYGETLSLTFEMRLRGEKKFDGIESLKAQLYDDIAIGREFLEKQKIVG